jgi:CDP-paratose synthetase
LKKSILIVGINGFLGSHLANYLKHNYNVIGLEHSLQNLFRIKNEGFTVYESKNIDALESIFDKHQFQIVINVATIYRRQGESISSLLETNVNLSVRMLEFSIKYNVRQYFNTDSFFNNSKFSYSYLFDYTLSKKQALEWIELLVKKTNCKVANMKIFHMYGENDAQGKFIPSIIEKIKGGERFVDLTAGEQTRDFIYVNDVVRAYECLIVNVEKLNQFQEFHVGTGESHSIKKLVSLIKELTGSSIHLKFGELPYRDGEIMNSSITNFKLFELGWRPLYSLKEGVKRIV